MIRKDYYLVLGVPRTATARGIKSAFRELAKAHHPDQTGSEETTAFKEILEAYEVLSDPERRRAYDRRHPAAAVRDLPSQPVGRFRGRGTAVRRHIVIEDLAPGPAAAPLIPEPAPIPEDFRTRQPSVEELVERLVRARRRSPTRILVRTTKIWNI